MKIIIKVMIVIMSVFISMDMKSQNIEVNTKNNVHVIFTSEIVKADVGNPNYSLIYKPMDKIIIIRGIQADKTNLFVETQDGLMYNFLLSYADEITNYYHLIKKEDAINYNFKSSSVSIDIKKKVLDSVSSDYEISNTRKVKNLYKNNKEAYFKKICANMTNENAYFTRTLAAQNNLKLQLMNIVYNKNEMYLYFEFTNKIKMNYEVEYMSFELLKKKNLKRSNAQNIIKEPIYIYKNPDKIKGKQKIRFVVVFDKFTIAKKKILKVEIKEKDGERDIYLTLNPKQINNPNIL